mgnify:CR=1 FL=1
MAAPLIVKGDLTFSPEAQRLFSKREWQRGLKASLIVAGRDFIAGALPKRFSSFVIEQGWYHAKKMDKTAGESREQQIRRAMALMRTNGERAKLVAQYCAPWGGWDPTGKGGPPDSVWRHWYANAVRTGRVRPAKNASDWQTARREMRRQVLAESRLLERIRNYAIDEYVDQGKQVEPIPLVQTGWLEKQAATKSRPDAKTRGDVAELRIVIPREDRVAPIVGSVLSKHTPAEAERVADITSQQMVAFIRSGKVSGTKKKPRLKTTSRQRRRIDTLIRGAMTKSARARATTSRPKTPESARG